MGPVDLHDLTIRKGANICCKPYDRSGAVEDLQYLKVNANGAITANLTAAFHSLIRETLFGWDLVDMEQLEQVTTNVHELGGNAQKLWDTLLEGGYLQSIDTPKQLAEVMLEMSIATWTKLDDHFVQSYKGTRPGSPMADVMLHFIMNKVTHYLKACVAEDQESQQICTKHNLTNEPIVWAVMGNDNSLILEKAAYITEKVDQYFERLGMEVNYSKGKSEVLVCYRGAGAAAQRREWLSGNITGCGLQGKADKENHLCITASCKHVGIYQEGAGAIDVEIDHRISQAWAMWRSIRTNILCCRRIRKSARVRLAFSLIMTKLFHGAGACRFFPESKPRNSTRAMSGYYA